MSIKKIKNIKSNEIARILKKHIYKNKTFWYLKLLYISNEIFFLFLSMFLSILIIEL